MRNFLIRVGSVLICFILAVLITSKLVNLDYQDLTADLSTATYPVVSIEYNGITINRLFGYTQDMKLSYMRGSITPLSEGRKMHIVINTYDVRISSVDYEVRTLNEKRLVEGSNISDYLNNGHDISADIILKDLYDTNEEYEFILLLTLGDGRTVRYYTRVINPSEYYISDKLEFVKDFNRLTFEKEEAVSLKTYLESNSKGDNSSFGYANINSKLDQVTWGELAPTQVTDPVITIKEIDSTTGSFIVDYYISIDEETNTKYYKVREFYRVRNGKERMYLLDYERTVDEVFTDEKINYGEDDIILGITGSGVAMKESEDGNNIAFVAGGRLYEYTVSTNRMASVFGYYDIYTSDERQMNDDFDIRIMNVDEQGNITFLVYGYMNRGTHEGYSGMSAYYYNGQVNTVEELSFIPSNLSPDMLMRKVEELAYMNSKGELYFLIGNALYGLSTDDISVRIITDSLKEGGYVVSDDNKKIAWIEGNGRKNSQRIVLKNLETGFTKNLDVNSTDTIVPIDFIGEDLIYGVAHKEDISLDRMGNSIIPMYELIIMNELEGDLMRYSEDGMYVIDGEVNGNQIHLTRVQKTENGFVEALDDQIVNAEEETAGTNIIQYIVTEKYEKQTVIALKKPIDVNSMEHLNPKLVMYEGDRTTNVDEDLDRGQFVVYGKYGAQSIHSDASIAVLKGYEQSGSVMNEQGEYIYKKTSLDYKNQIMAIQPDAATDARTSLAVSLDTMMSYGGVIRNSQYMLNQGYSVLEILNESMEDCQVLDLTGCTLDIVLYYINKDIPVLVMTDSSSAVLLIGYNETEVVIMDPVAGDIHKITREEAARWFESSGNGYITYLKRAK